MKLIFLSLILSSQVFAYSPRDILIDPDQLTEEALKERSSLNPSMLKREIEMLISVFREGYGGWANFHKQFEYDIFPQLRKIPADGLSTRTVCHSIANALAKINDYHLNAKYYGVERCGDHVKRKGNVGQNTNIGTQNSWGYFNKTRGRLTIPVISITSMAQSVLPEWNGFLDRVREVMAHAPALVIDLRGNTGGDDSKPHEMARILFGIDNQDVDLFPAARLVKRQTPAAIALLSNVYASMLAVAKWKNQSIPELENVYREYLNDFESSMAGRIPNEISHNFAPATFDFKRIFKGPIRILIDAECGSSCEWAVSFFEKHPNARLVGENTAGMIHFGNVGAFWLRHSNVLVSIPNQSWYFADRRSMEKVGFQPHIVVPPGQDAMDFALQDIEATLRR